MYLNKNCFRGLYRVNKKGMFNTSFSHARNHPVFVEENIIELSKIFQLYDVKFEVRDYFDLDIDNCVAYFDPPYYNTYDEYNVIRFNHDDYIERLIEIRSNCSVTLFHSNCYEFQNVYDTDENIEEISCQERMNSKKQDATRVELFYY